jgi:bifunctional ADP-heptose synthase (sugar kinase/adenylyltransferase)
VFWLDDGAKLGHLAGHPIAAVDTLGAGDIFHAAFALALAEGRGEADATRFGNAAAALKCARPGGGAGAPTRGEVETFLGSRASDRDQCRQAVGDAPARRRRRPVPDDGARPAPADHGLIKEKTGAAATDEQMTAVKR